jgi:hypothetical protein
MRTVVAMLACLGVGAISLALADPSTTAPGTSAAPPSAATSAPTAAAPATPAAAAPTAAAPAAPAANGAPALDPKEQQLLAKGYKMQMRNGQRVFCRHEEELGSRVGGKTVCATPDQLIRAQLDAKDTMQQAQRQMNPPSK